ncbi:hypothetical protein G6F68_015928 [Rhizopus microsporus]|nr:hypothetical protein G6F68_015928 [Rhizopus microsporus]
MDVQPVDDTAKYWIHPDNITEIKSIIMLHLPVYIQNPDKRYEPSDAAVSNVYLDNQEFGLYTSILQRDDDAEAIRFRWNGPPTSPTVFAERSTHRAHWLDGASVKDRLELATDDVQRFLSGG